MHCRSGPSRCTLINIVASPLSFLFFITIASNGVLLAYGIGGGMLMTMLSIGTSLQTDISHYRQDLKLQDVVVASPVEAWVYVAGIALSELVYSLPGLAVFVLLWGCYGWANLAGGLTLILVLLLVWAFASALGFTLATFLQDVRETFVFSGIDLSRALRAPAGVLPDPAPPGVARAAGVRLPDHCTRPTCFTGRSASRRSRGSAPSSTGSC